MRVQTLGHLHGPLVRDQAMQVIARQLRIILDRRRAMKAGCPHYRCTAAFDQADRRFQLAAGFRPIIYHQHAIPSRHRILRQFETLFRPAEIDTTQAACTNGSTCITVGSPS